MSLIHHVGKFKQMAIRYALVSASGEVSVPAGAENVIDVKPPTGEVWEVSAGNEIDYPGGNGASMYFDGTYVRGSYHRKVGEAFGASGFIGFITDSLYLRLYIRNPDTVAHPQRYGYVGYKVKASSIPHISLFVTKYPRSELARYSRQSPNPHGSVTLPDYLKPLERYAFIDWEGEVAIYLEKDMSLRKDEVGNVIELMNTWVKIKEIEHLFRDLIDDTTKRPLMTYIRERSVAKKMGWEKYIDKWREEGIEF